MVKSVKITEVGKKCDKCLLIGICSCNTSALCHGCYLEKTKCVCNAVVAVLKAVQRPLGRVISVDFINRRRK